MEENRHIETYMKSEDDHRGKQKLWRALLASFAVVLLAAVGFFGFSMYRYYRYQKAVVSIQQVMTESIGTIQQCTYDIVSTWQKQDGSTLDERYQNAISALSKDEGYQNKILKIKNYQNKVTKLSKRLQHAPKAYEKINPMLIQACKNYQELTDLVIEPTSNINTIYQRFDRLYKETIQVLAEIQQQTRNDK